MPRSHILGVLILGSSLAIGVAQAAPRPACGTPSVLRGDVVVAVPPLAPIDARDSGKAVLFQPLEGRLDTKNFSIQWQPDASDATMAGIAGEALEAGWQALIVEQGWPQPVSSDAFLVPVFIDPSIVGTGLTAEYAVDDYPQGVPIIYLHPDSAADEPFFRALSAHELHHAIQYRMRGEYSSAAEEAWYWEASAEWASELALPGLNIYAWSSRYYSERPSLRFDSVEDSHQYGMFVLNAYLEEFVSGAGGMRAVWELSTDRPAVPWDVLLVEATGESVDVLWGGFVTAMAEESLRESSLYFRVVNEGLTDGVEGRIALLGADFFLAPGAGTLVVVTPNEDESAMAVGLGGLGESIEVSSGDMVGILGLTDGGADYRLEFTRDTSQRDDDDDPGSGCACGSQPPRSFALLWLLLPVGGRRRRR